MIRIKGTSPPIPPPEEPQLPLEEAPPELPVEPEVPALPSKMSADKVDPLTVVYKTPDMGPFMCGNCLFFEGTDSCSLVSGPILPDGVCNLFTQGDAPEEAPLEEPEASPLDEEALPEESPQ